MSFVFNSFKKIGLLFFQKKICVFSIAFISLVGVAEALDIEAVGIEANKKTSSLASVFSTESTFWPTQERIKEAAYVTANVCDGLEKLSKFGAGVGGLVSLFLLDDDMLSLATISLSFASLEFNASKNALRKYLLKPLYNADVTTVDAESQPKSHSVHVHHDEFINFVVKYIDTLEPAWKTAWHVMDHLEGVGQYAAPPFQTVGRYWSVGILLKIGYALNALSTSCFFGKIFAENQLKKKHEERLAVEEMPDV